MNEPLPISSLLVEDRFRQDYGDIDDLADDIRERGLIQPIVVNKESNGTHRLMAGGRRLTALKQLGFDILHHGVTCDPKRPGFVFSSELSRVDQRLIELMENLKRKEQTWREDILACVEIHRLFKQQSATKWTQAQTADKLGYSAFYVSNCLDLVDALKDDRFDGCMTVTDAIKLRAKHREDAAVAEKLRRDQLAMKDLGRKTLLEVEDEPEPVRILKPMPCVACEGSGKRSNGDPCPICKGVGQTEQYEIVPYVPPEEQVVNLSNSLFLGNFLEILPTWPAECVHHIITDPPYGIDMDNLEQQNTGMASIDRVKDTHQVASNLELLVKMWRPLYHVLKPGGYCMVCCDIMNWQLMYDAALDAGFKVQRWPVYWDKTSPCLNQYATVNFTKTIEFVMIARKGNATLVSQQPRCGVSCPREETKSNPFAKPFDLWAYLIRSCSHEGQTVLDVCAGEGSCVMAALRLGRKPTAIELDQTHYSYLVQNVKKHYEGQRVRFV